MINQPNIYKTELEKKDILYLDNHLFVVNKKAGLLVQGDKTGDTTLLELCKAYLKKVYQKPGNVFLALVHRLDRPTSGVVVFGRTSKAASRLSEQFREHKIKKIYWALVRGCLPEQGEMQDFLLRKEQKSFTVSENGKSAALCYKRLAFQNDISLVEIEMKTGRHHQIRVQFSSRGFPIIGDFKYGSKTKFPNGNLALHARSVTLFHPVTKETMTFQANPDKCWNSFIQLPADNF